MQGHYKADMPLALCFTPVFPLAEVAATTSGPSAAALFYLTLLFIFLTAVVTTVFTKWARDKCLKLFHGYHVTLERSRGQTTWGRLKVFSAGIEVVFDHPFVDVEGRKKTSTMIYGPEVEPQVLSLLRYHNELDEASRRLRDKQIRTTFNPGPLRRFSRKVRNFVNTLRDAFNAAIGAAVGQYQRMNPAGGGGAGGAVLATQGQSVTAIGQTILGKFAGNAYEPLLEQYIGQPVILDVADPLDPNNATVSYAGFLADYTQSFVAVFNVEHTFAEEVELELPDADRGDPLPPLPPPPGPGAAPAPLTPPRSAHRGLEVRLDGPRVKIHNASPEAVVVRRLVREGFEPLEIGAVIPPRGQIDLPARDTRAGRLRVDLVRCTDVVAPRKYAVIRHAGELVERRGIAEELSLSQLPLVPRILGLGRGNGGRHEKGDAAPRAGAARVVPRAAVRKPSPHGGEGRTRVRDAAPRRGRANDRDGGRDRHPEALRATPSWRNRLSDPTLPGRIVPPGITRVIPVQFATRAASPADPRSRKQRMRGPRASIKPNPYDMKTPRSWGRNVFIRAIGDHFLEHPRRRPAIIRQPRDTDPTPMHSPSPQPLLFPAALFGLNGGTMETILLVAAAVVIGFLGYRLGRFVGAMAAGRSISQKEQELFTAQKGFKNLYEQELAALKTENASLQAQVKALHQRVEDYRKKAAGFGGLFSSASKRSDAMYALLLENEALEEALYAQNEKLRQERTDSLKEQLRATGYRRVLMSQLLNDDRIKGYVREIMEDHKQLPPGDEAPPLTLPPAEHAS